VEATILSEQFS